MNKIKYLLFLLLFSSCIHRQSAFKSYETKVLLNENYTLSLPSGIISSIDTIEQNVLYHLFFDAVKGGDTRLFGKWTLKEGNGYKAKRLQIEKNNRIIHSLSINDLKGVKQSVVPLNQFIASSN